MTVAFLDLARSHALIASEFKSAFETVLARSQFVMGPELNDFEREFASFCGARHCIGVANGLDALELLLRAYEIRSGHEVIVPSNTFVATLLAVSKTGATPVPVEPDQFTHNIAVDKIRAAVTKRTRVIIPVHLYGQTADMEPINDLAAEAGLVVIEDAAQAHGARYKGRRAGALGHAAGTSFYPGKNLGCLGDGGAVLTNDPLVAERVRILRNYGSSQKYLHERLGSNSRLDEVQAAFLRIKLRHLDDWNARRRLIASRYLEGLKDTDLVLPRVQSDMEHVWHLFVVRSSARDRLQQHLASAGIGTVVHYPVPPHLQPCYAPWPQTYPIAERLAREVLSLPMSPHQTEAETDRVIEAIRLFRQ